MEKLLNFVEPFDVNLLDYVVNTVYTGTPQNRDLAQKVLTQLQEHPDAWMRVDTILEYSQSPQTKFFALQILENVIKFRWKILPKEQTAGIRSYIVGLIIKLSSDEATLRSQHLLLTKLNLILVQIIKQEWPRKWENFIPEIVGASETNESLCENNMAILRLMSEEIFDYSKGQMTEAKIKELKNTFNKEFSLIYRLCELVLNNSQKPSLLLATLQTLLRFLNWIPLGYIFETKMIEILLFKFFPVVMFRNVTLQCLTEIGSLSINNFGDEHFGKLFVSTLGQLKGIIPLEADIAASFENGTDEEQSFVLYLSLFLTGFFKAHLNLLEKAEYQQALIEGHTYLTKISLVDDIEIFKICLEYWNILASSLYHETPYQQQSPLLLGSMQSAPPSRRTLYAPILSKVRLALIRRMPRPEEVLIVEDENGEIVKETVKDSDSIILYKSMRETLVFLTHLDYEDTQHIMLDKLARQVDGTEWSWNNLNTLCWAIGAISGAQSEEYEKRFLVTVIKDLLGLTEMKRGKDNKAVVASNIMYIVGQYPRFLRAHWKFLKTVVNKLFEFMHETHPGVQDMACDTFLKISQKCARKFVVVQLGETQPFIEEILANLPRIICDLEDHHIHSFYESAGWMIASQTDTHVRDNLILKLMELPNKTWAEIMAHAARNIETLRQPETIKNVSNILKTNVRVASSLGHAYITQLGRIYLDMLNVYKAYSEMISNVVASAPHMAQTSIIRSMRTVKRETLKTIEMFIEKSTDPQVVAQNFIPPLLEAILVDYQNNIPDARDPEVLSLMAAIINKLKSAVASDVPRIFVATFECTLGMITKNFQDYPEHRINFFNLLRAINCYCFQAFFAINANHFKLVIDSIVWAFKHTERNIAETGLNILLDLLKNISQAGAELSAFFYKSHFLPLLQDIFVVLTDTFHKSGFKLQATILQQMIDGVESGVVTTPLWSHPIQDPTMNNQKFLREYIVNLLSNSFPNLTSNQINHFVLALFDARKDLNAFKNTLRDFLVQLKEFAGDNDDLFLEEKEASEARRREEEKRKAMSIPGMIAPNDLPDEMVSEYS